MKHLHRNRILSRTSEDRKALLQNLTSSLLEHGAITTTEAKAKELRGFFEPLVTLAKRGETLHIRRQLLRVLTKEDTKRIYAVAAAAKTRPGGYLRLTRLPITRGDAARMMHIEIIDL
jgi:large subunit ribosomal protein L17